MSATISSSTVPAGLIAASAAIMITLGLLHLLFTYNGNQLHPRDGALLEKMKSSTMVIARTSMWNAWIGFDASHSLGLLLFGTVFGYLALAHPALYFGSPFLGATGLAALLAYLVMARRYWFSRPLQGVALALTLYVGGWLGAVLLS